MPSTSYAVNTHYYPIKCSCCRYRLYFSNANFSIQEIETYRQFVFRFCIYDIPKILGYGVEEERISNIFSFSKLSMIEKGLGETFQFPLMPGYIKNTKPIKGYSLI